MKPRIKRHKTSSLLRNSGKIDYLFLFGILTLLLIGIIMVYEASVVEAQQIFSNKMHFIIQQSKWAVLGLISMFVCTFVPINFVKKYAPHAFLFTLVLLVLVVIPGIGNHVQGARRWLNIAGFTLQPSEVTKLTFLLYLSVMFEKKPNAQIFITSLAIIVILVMLQPDLGTAIVITSSAMATYFVAGAPLTHFLAITVSGLISISTLIAFSPYRRERLFTFLDPSRDPLGASYHIRQILLALGSGGMFGTGIGRSIQKYQYLPESTTDSIFAVIAEETGFIGTIIIISLFLFVTFRGLKIASGQQDRFKSTFAVSLTLLIAVQAFLNLSALSALVPLTGIPLPFISYGGSSLLVMLTSSGFLLNLSRNNT